jgi:hypothetical protein
VRPCETNPSPSSKSLLLIPEGVSPGHANCKRTLVEVSGASGSQLMVHFDAVDAIYGQGANSAGGMESLFFLPAVMALIFAGWPMTSRSAYGFSVS